MFNLTNGHMNENENIKMLLLLLCCKKYFKLTILNAGKGVERDSSDSRRELTNFPKTSHTAHVRVLKSR